MATTVNAELVTEKREVEMKTPQASGMITYHSLFSLSSLSLFLFLFSLFLFSLSLFFPLLLHHFSHIDEEELNRFLRTMHEGSLFFIFSSLPSFLSSLNIFCVVFHSAIDIS